jgi:hypothetical protein
MNPLAQQNINCYVEAGFIPGMYQWFYCSGKSMNTTHLTSRKDSTTQIAISTHAGQSFKEI